MFDFLVPAAVAGFRTRICGNYISVYRPWCVMLFSALIWCLTMDRPAFVTPKEYAEYRGVHLSTIMRWIKQGRVPAEQPAGKKGRYAIPAELLEKIAYPPAPGWPERPI